MLATAPRSKETWTCVEYPVLRMCNCADHVAKAITKMVAENVMSGIHCVVILDKQRHWIYGSKGNWHLAWHWEYSKRALSLFASEINGHQAHEGAPLFPQM